MRARLPHGGAAGAGLAVTVLFHTLPMAAAPLETQDVAAICAEAEDPAHCGRLVEAVQMQRLPALAIREGAVLKISLFPSGTATFTDTEALDGGRTYSLWDFLSEINAALLYTTDGDTIGFRLLQRTNGRSFELPTEPKVSPDRVHLATADFCATRCVNELAIWRVTRDGLLMESVWSPNAVWADASVSWKGPDTVVVEYTIVDGGKPATLERRLADPGWRRMPSR